MPKEKTNLSMKLLITLLVLLLAFLQYQLMFAKNGVSGILHLKKMLSLKTAKNTALEQENANLTKDIIALKKGGAAIEARARHDLGMIKKGEIFYRTVANKP